MPFEFETPYLMCIFGKSGSGKSWLLKHLMIQSYQTNQHDIFFVLTGTKQNGFFQEFMDSKFVYNYSHKILLSIMKKAKKFVEEGRKINIMLVLDDCVAELSNNKAWKHLINNYRHYNISPIIISQYINLLTPNVRTNCKYCFIFNQTTKAALDASYNSYGISHYNEEEWNKILAHLPKYHCLFVVTDGYEKKEKYQKYKAPAELPNEFIRNA